MEGLPSLQDLPRNAAQHQGERDRGQIGCAAHQVREFVRGLPFHIAAEEQQGGAGRGRLLQILPQRWAGLDQGPQRVQRQDNTVREQGRGKGTMEAGRFEGNDQAALVLPAGEELLQLPRRAARGAREQRRPSAGSAFELVSWSQGEVRHNTWHSKGRENVPASAARMRMLYLVGLGVELETALRAVGKATVRKAYAFEMAKRADRARKQLAAAAKAAAERAGNRKDDRTRPFGRAEAEQ